MKKIVVTATAVFLPLVFAGPAVSEPTPVEPGPPAAVLAEPVASGPLGTTFPIRTGGDMAVTVHPSEAEVAPRTERGSVLVFDVSAEQTAGKPYFLPTLDLRLITTNGDMVYPLAGVPGEYPGGFVEPEQPRNGLVAFELTEQQQPEEIVFATNDDFVQGAWTL
ncbi:hypothetical protein HGA13_05185 [Nocardia speluncae]|uniref:DUF4352 domain-containing protein n=1 Tax=Nocardia speluncae TaxID=419477 RepID=A0A846XCG8_9NOCA|nr:hypothetical protein [Nocardia speluncae]NKY32470.1 hypothetical protein [Nocardia speluncae]